MNRPSDPFSGWRQHALMLAVFACVLRAFIPMGFMPGANTTMIICSGMEGQQTAQLDGHDPSQPAQQKNVDACPFAVNAAGTAVDIITITAPFTATPSIERAATAFLFDQLFALYGSRAPPASLTV